MLSLSVFIGLRLSSSDFELSLGVSLKLCQHFRDRVQWYCASSVGINKRLSAPSKSSQRWFYRSVDD